MYLNTEQKWASILQNVQKGIKSIFPIEAKTGKIELLSLEVPNKTNASIGNQKTKLLSGTSLSVPIYANLRLVRNNGKTETGRVKILDLPVLTDRGTFIVQGKDYSVFNQVRLKPGVFVRHVNDSDAVFADFNLGRGLGFEIHMDNNGVFFVKFDKSKLSSSSKRIPLYSLLSALGTSDMEMSAVWGNKILEVNKAKAKPSEDIKQIVNTVIYPTKRTGNDSRDLQDYFKETALTPETTKVTLGTGYSSVTPKTLLDASAKIVKVYNNKEEEDDLDSLLFKEVLGVEDHLMLRIEKKAKEEEFWNNIEVGKKYTLTETIPADGYATAESITFVVENTADIQKVEMQDDTTKILISKVDMTDGSSEVKGAKLYILNENQEVMESWTSGDQPHYVEKLSVGTYTLLEETAPKGYIVANKVTFEVKDTGDVQGAKMEDEQAMGKVILNKTDKDTKKPMKGVEFALCDSKGKVLETLVTDSAGHAESKNYPIATFKNGQYKKAITYILKETKTLDGYQLDETEHKIQFEYVNDRTPVIEYTLDLTNKKAPEKDTPETSENQGVSTPVSHGSDATSVSNSPKTGDNTNIAIFVLALAVSAGCLGTVVAVKRKRK